MLLWVGRYWHTVLHFTAKRIFAVLREENGQRSQTSFQSEANLQLLPDGERQVHHDNSTVSVHFTSLVTVGFMSYCPLFVEASELSCETNTFGPAAVDSSLTEVSTTFVISCFFFHMCLYCSMVLHRVSWERFITFSWITNNQIRPLYCHSHTGQHRRWHMLLESNHDRWGKFYAIN